MASLIDVIKLFWRKSRFLQKLRKSFTTSTRYWIKSMTGSGKELISRTIGTRSVTWQVNFRTETHRKTSKMLSSLSCGHIRLLPI